MYRYQSISVVLILLSHQTKFALSQTRRIDPVIQGRIDHYIQNVYLPGSEISGLGLAIVGNDGELLYTTGYGMADVERQIPNGNQTQFLIASITKSFTSVVVSKLLNERFPEMGEAVLDTPIRQLLPQINFTLIDRFRSEHVNMRDLLSHRVCTSPGALTSLSGAFETSQEVAYHQRYNEEVCGIRTDFQYNNHMYTVAGEIIEELANKPYVEVIQDLLDDLGMADSAFMKCEDDSSQMPNRAKAYYMQHGEPHLMNQDLLKRIIPDLPAGGLFVTPNDMTKYMRFRLNLGSLDGRQIVPKEVMEWQSKPSNLFNFNGFKRQASDLVLNQYGYALGLFLSTYDGWEYLQHGGDFPSFNSLFSLYPAKNLSIHTSVNLGPVMIDRLLLHANLFEILEGNENIEEKMEKLAEQIQNEKKSKAIEASSKVESLLKKLKTKSSNQCQNSKEREDLTGIYGDGGLGEVNVTERFNDETNQTQYYVQYARWYTGWLEETGTENLFYLRMDTDAIQDDYAIGAPGGIVFVAFEGENLSILKSLGELSQVFGTFKLGTRLDLLPEIPWSPDSC